MKKLKYLALLYVLGMSFSGAQAAILITDFSTPFTTTPQVLLPMYNSWNDGVDDQYIQDSNSISITTVGLGNPKGDGSFDSDVSLSTTPVDFSANSNYIVLGAELLAGNTDTSFKITLLDSTYTVAAYATFLTSSFNATSFTNVYSQTTMSSGAISDVQFFSIAGDGQSDTAVRVSFNNLQASAVPEPATWMLLAGGLTTVMVLRRRHSGV
jgi:PEP-CTERM motif